MRTPCGILLVAGVPLLLFFALHDVPRDVSSPAIDASWMGTTMPDTAIVNLFERECASCHGEDGTGKTKAGRRAGSKDFTDSEYQATWTNEEAIKVISTAKKDGKQLRNKKPFEGKLTKEQMKLLVEHVRTFAEKK